MKILLAKTMLLTLAALLLGLTDQVRAEAPERTPAPAGARAYFVSPGDGAVVASPVTIRFGLEGMGVAPAGVKHPATGHHHLLINLVEADLPPFDRPLPASDQIVHFGGGQTQVSLELKPGVYRLQLLLGDWLHIPHEPPVISEPITITVK